MKKYYFFILCIATLISCDKDQSETEKAWKYFKNQDYTAAHEAFSELISTDRINATTGLGWICLRMDSLPEADKYFQSIEQDTCIDAFVGWTALLWQQKNYTESIEKGTHVLLKSPKYKFSYDNSITIQDVIIHLGFSYFYQGNFSKCCEMISLLDSGFSQPALNDPKIEEILIIKLEQLAELFN